MRDRPMLWNVNRKSQVADLSVSVPITLSDLEKGMRGVKFSGRSILNNARRLLFDR